MTVTAAFQGDEGRDGLALDIVGTAHHGGFGDLGMGHQRGLDLHGGEAVAADVEHVVDPAHHPDVSVLVHAGAVSGEVDAGNVGPVLLT